MSRSPLFTFIQARIPVLPLDDGITFLWITWTRRQPFAVCPSKALRISLSTRLSEARKSAETVSTTILAPTLQKQEKQREVAERANREEGALDLAGITEGAAIKGRTEEVGVG